MLPIVPKVHFLILSNANLNELKKKNYCAILKFSDYEELLKTELKKLDNVQFKTTLYNFILKFSCSLNYLQCLLKEYKQNIKNCKQNLNFRPLLIVFNSLEEVQMFINVMNHSVDCEEITMFFSMEDLNSAIPALPFASKLFPI